MGAADTPLFAAEEAKKALIGLARDLRGLAYAFNTKTSYMMLFDWMYVRIGDIMAHGKDPDAQKMKRTRQDVSIGHNPNRMR